MEIYVVSVIMFLLSRFMASFMAASAGDFNQEVVPIWGGDRAKILSGGKVLSLTLDKTSGSGFESKREYLFGRIDMQIKLVAGNSAGSVTAYYVSQLFSESSFLSHNFAAQNHKS